jgi:hypothetical protein
MIKKFDEYKKPKFQKGDRCIFIYPVGKYKVLSILDNNMVIEDEPFWNEERNEWSYPIVGKSNPTEENFLILYSGQEEGDVVEQK